MGQSSSKKNFNLRETIEPTGLTGSIILKNGDEDRPDGISKSSSQARPPRVNTAAADNNVSMTTNPPSPSNSDKVYFLPFAPTVWLSYILKFPSFFYLTNLYP